MKTEFATKKLTDLGWTVKEIEYSKPTSGFKCVDGGYFCKVETDDEDYGNLKAIPFDDNVFGSIHGTGEGRQRFRSFRNAIRFIIPTW